MIVTKISIEDCRQAQGYLLKETEPDELLNAIRRPSGQYIRRCRSKVQRLSNPELSEENWKYSLTAQGMSNADIAAALSIGEGTVKSHVNQF